MSSSRDETTRHARHLAICIGTFRRPEMLRALLESVRRMTIPEGIRAEVRVVDNDPEASAAPVLKDLSPIFGAEMPLIAMHVPVSNIARARNAAIERPSDLVLFLDDDETTEPDLLVEMLAARERTGADVVIGMVRARLASSTPRWLAESGLLDHPTGTRDEVLDWAGTRCGCTFVDASWFHERGFRFDEAFGRSGGEDVDLFARMLRAGALAVSAPDAVSWETLPPRRANLGALARRYWHSGASYARIEQPEERRNPVLRFGFRLLKAAGHGLRGVVRARRVDLARALLTASLACGGLQAWLFPEKSARAEAYGPGKRAVA
ncbi:MAG: glycosyltransferase [Acidobacteriota bacterium]